MQVTRRERTAAPRPEDRAWPPRALRPEGVCTGRAVCPLLPRGQATRFLVFMQNMQIQYQVPLEPPPEFPVETRETASQLSLQKQIGPDRTAVPAVSWALEDTDGLRAISSLCSQFRLWEGSPPGVPAAMSRHMSRVAISAKLWSGLCTAL